MTSQPDYIFIAPEQIENQDYWDAGTWRAHPDGGAEYVRADLRPVVKPLEWEGSDFYCEARVFGLVYSTNLIQGRWFYIGNAYAELDDAKAAAQADYEQRILSALALAPVTPAQAAKVLLEAMNDQPAVNSDLDMWRDVNSSIVGMDAWNGLYHGLRAIAEGGA